MPVPDADSHGNKRFLSENTDCFYYRVKIGAQNMGRLIG